MFEIGFAAQKLSEFSIQSRKVAFGHLDPRTHLSADQTVPGHAQLVLQSSFLPGNLPPGNQESGQIGASRGRGPLLPVSPSRQRARGIWRQSRRFWPVAASYQRTFGCGMGSSQPHGNPHHAGAGARADDSCRLPPARSTQVDMIEGSGRTVAGLLCHYSRSATGLLGEDRHQDVIYTSGLNV